MLPSFFKNLIPGPTSNLCEKFNKLAVGLSQGVADWVSEEYNEDGQSLTDEFVVKLCAANCGPGGGGGGGGGGSTSCIENPAMPTPTGLTASDGAFSSKVNITWNASTPPSGSVTNYLLYRALSTELNTANAVLIASVGGSIYTYDDTTVSPGTIYNYWVRATNGIETSCYAGPDTGNASNGEVTLPAVTNLRATQGVPLSGGGNYIRLMFQTTGGVTAVDIYRNTVNTLSTATKIAVDKAGAFTSDNDPTVADGLCINNGGGDLVYFDLAPSATTKYYYWVVQKADSPPRTSPESASAIGWVQLGTGDAGAGSELQFTIGVPVIIPGGITKMRVCGIGGGGAGSGSTAFHSGGGGSGGDVLLALVTVAPGDEFTLATFFQHNAGSATGSPGPLITSHYQYEGQAGKLTRTADGKRIVVGGGTNGMYSNDGSGEGGVVNANNSFVDAGITTTELGIFRGATGENASGTRGGRGGAAYGFFANAPSNYLGGASSGHNAQDIGSGGGGSSTYGTFQGGANPVPRMHYCLIP